MNGSLLLCIALAYFVAAYLLYGGFLSRLFGVDDKRPTPAVIINDGVDYVPTNAAVLFGHHFSSIAGAGPIVGPIMASYYGWLPALLWILIGCVFVGAMHDFAALFLSVRNQGKSIGYIIEKLMGFKGRQLFLVFCWASLILVIAIFGLMVAGTFIHTPSVAFASIVFIFMAPVFGWVTKHLLSLRTASFIFVPLVFAVVWVSEYFPIDLQTLYSENYGLDAATAKTWALNTWLLVLGVYVFIASVAPVQWLLQPRDYLSSYLLYALLLFGLVGILFYSPEIKLPAFTEYNAKVGIGETSAMIPSLFIFIACGACSGFHSLVASGTTSKQIRRESHMQMIGYGGMIVEGVLGVMSLITVAYLSGEDFNHFAANPVQGFAHGVGVFLAKIGVPEAAGSNFISLAISAFMLTSLDTATRLARFVQQEIFSPSYTEKQEKPVVEKKHPLVKFITDKYVASFCVIVISGFMVGTGSANSIWPIFGASNQLLAALTLLGITLYLMTKKMNFWISLLPTVLMMVMSIWGLIDVITAHLDDSLLLVGAALFLIVMALILTILSVIILKRHLKHEISLD